MFVALSFQSSKLVAGQEVVARDQFNGANPRNLTASLPTRPMSLFSVLMLT